METKFKQGAVTFIDVLGWKGIWQRSKNPIEWLEHILDNANNYIKQIKEIEKGVWNDCDFEIISISDTIVMLTEYDNPQKSLEFHAAICSLLVKDCFKSGMFLRGAITYGRYHHKNNIFVGPAIDEVAEWHECANWIGVHLTPTANLLLKKVKDTTSLVEYNVPLKSGRLHTKCVNWPRIIYSKDDMSNYIVYDAFAKSNSNTPGIYIKYENTIIFYEDQMKKLGCDL